MTTALRVAALELPHLHGHVDRCLARFDEALARVAPTADLVLLHECALTGYVSPWGDFDLAPFAEPTDGPTAARLADLARRHRVALAGPLVEREGARCFNGLALWDDAGARVGHWRKRHPWFPERCWASEGDLGTPVVTWRGLRVTACVCFDIHFVADEAAPSLREADVLLFPTAWVDERRRDDLRARLLPPLARRFGLTVLNANWGVGEPRVWGMGRSRVVSPDGATTLAAPLEGLDASVVHAALTPRAGT